MSTQVECAISENIALITLNGPPANTYSYEMMKALDAVILDLRMNDAVEVIVLTGAGDKFFCAGADIAMLNEATPAFKYAFCLHANETLRRLENTSKIVIAAINGHCVGGGLEVALACDFRLAWQSSAKIGLPEVKLGVLPGTGGTARLTKLLGASKALELMARGDNMSVQKAYELGIVTQCIEADSRHAFLTAVWNYAKGFCTPENASMAAGLIKRSVQAGQALSLDDHLALERELQQRLFTSADAKEGIVAYNEKRKPVFQGS